MRGEPPRPPRWADFGGGSKRGLEDEWRGNPMGWDRRNARGEEVYNRDSWAREQATQRRGPRDDDGGFKRRMMDSRGVDSGRRQQDDLRSNLQQGNKSSTSALDRIGGPHMEEGPRGWSDEPNTGGFRPRDLGTCRWCGQEGHHQANFTNAPMCFRCKNSGHVASQCPQIQGCKMRMLGFGFPGHGFYSLQIPETKASQTSENMACIEIVNGQATSERVEEGLKQLIDDKWDWKVRQITDSQYLAEFPNKVMLTAFSKSKGVEFAAHNIFAKVMKSSVESTASSILQSGWVKLYNIPPKYRNEDVVRVVAELAGVVEVIDELSIIRDGPVRVKITGRNINSLKGIVEVFFGKTGHEIKFIAETAGGGYQPTPKNPPPRRPDEDETDEEDDNNKDGELEWEKMKRQYEKEKQQQSNNGKQGSSQGQHKQHSTWKGSEEPYQNKDSSRMDKEEGGNILETLDPETIGELNTSQTEEEIVISQVPSEMEGLSSQELEPLNMDPSGKLKEVENLDQESVQPVDWGTFDQSDKQFHCIDFNKMLVHDEDGVRWMDKDKWPKLVVNMTNAQQMEGGRPKEAEQINKQITVEENVTDGIVEDDGWVLQSATVTKKARRYNPVIAARKSSRTQTRGEASSSNNYVGGATVTELENSSEGTRKGMLGRATAEDAGMDKGTYGEYAHTGGRLPVI
ncbi:unnamed protein product [Urochloa humidicola]